MNVVILEDENRSANHLQRVIASAAPERKVISVFCHSAGLDVSVG